ncbi:MAG: MltA domain-containing protein [Caulobacteraceae bacterium]
MFPQRWGMVGLAALALAGCGTTPKPAVTPPVTPPPPAISTPPVTPPPLSQAWSREFAALPGWADDDHAAALAAFRATCGAARDPAWAEVCRKARDLGPVSELAARRFLETNFRPEALTGDGLLTAYYAPEYEARDRPDAEFSAPVRPRPADLRVTDGSQAYPDRTVIEARPAGDALAWMRPEDLFFLQIQGSGSLTFPDGRRLRAIYDSNNGKPFRGIATAMRQRGLLAENNTSGDAIIRWLAAHRGPEADEIMQLNPRYVFFRLGPDDGADPAGAAGVPLPAARSIAVDTSLHPLGELYWIDAKAPVLNGAFPVYQRLVIALDTGGAIKGEVRADLYLGRGAAAGVEAGRVRHTLRLWRLVPVVDPWGPR